MKRLNGAGRTFSKVNQKSIECNIFETASCSDDVVPSSQEETNSELADAQSQEPWCKQPDLALAICQARAYYRTFFKVEAERPRVGKVDEKWRIEYRNFLSADLILKKLLEVFVDHVHSYEKKHVTRTQELSTVQTLLNLWEHRVELLASTTLPYCVDDPVLDGAVDILKIQHDEKSAAEELDLDEEVLGIDSSISELSLVHYEGSITKGSAFNKHSLTLVDGFVKQRKLLHNEIAQNNNNLRKLEKRLQSIKSKVLVNTDLIVIPSLGEYIEKLRDSAAVLLLQDMLDEC